MGVVTAVPTSEYEILSVDITRIGETKRMKRSPKPTFIEKLVGTFDVQGIKGRIVCKYCET